MLCLSRFRNESVVIGSVETGEVYATVTFIESRGDKIRLGFDADKSVFIHRREVWDAICRQKGGSA